MAATAVMPKAALAKLLDGTYDVAAASLKVAILDSSWTYPDVNDDALVFDSSSATGLLESLAISGQSWAWDDSLRVRTLVLGSSVDWTPGADEAMRYIVVFDAGDALPPLSVISFPLDQVASASTLHSLELDPLLAVQLWSSQDPTPVGNVASPVLLTDTDEVSWRVTAIGGALGAMVTSEDDPRQTFLTSPDATLWLLVVSVTGDISVGPGAYEDGDRVFNASLPCLLPSEDPATQYVLSVDNSGVLAVT